MENPKRATQRLAELYADRGDPNGWFEESYSRAVEAITDLVGPEGNVLVSCRSRNAGEPSDTFPLALDRNEIKGFQRADLSETRFVAYDDDQDPPVPHFFAVYKRSA